MESITAQKKLLLFVSVLSVLFLVGMGLPGLRDPTIINEIIKQFGMVAPLIYMFIMAVAIVVSPIPSLPLAVSAGIFFGPFWGLVYTLVGAEIGAIIAFLIARHMGKQALERLLQRKFKVSNKLSERKIATIIFVSRLFPVFQFDIISYGAGLLNVSLRHFAIATFFGMIPVTFLATYFGSVVFLGDMVLVGVVSLLLILALITVPLLIAKYNLFGLKGKLF